MWVDTQSVYRQRWPEHQAKNCQMLKLGFKHFEERIKFFIDKHRRIVQVRFTYSVNKLLYGITKVFDDRIFRGSYWQKVSGMGVQLNKAPNLCFSPLG